MLNWVIPYLIAGGVMWLVAYQMAPVGREIPLSHAIIAVFLMGLCGVVSNLYLKPSLGHWRILAELIAHALVVMAMFQLSLSRSLLAVLVYWLVMVIAIVVMTALAKTQKRSWSWSPDGTAFVGCNSAMVVISWTRGTDQIRQRVVADVGTVALRAAGDARL